MMKHLLIICLVLSGTCQSLLAQEQDDLELLTSGKWYIEFMEKGNEKIDIPSEIQKEFWMLFRADGTYENMGQGVVSNGEWTFDETRRIITTNDSDGSTAQQQIISITKDKLVLSVKEENAEFKVGMMK